MANRLFKQFFFSFSKKLVGLHGKISVVQAVKATKVTQGLTLTAAAFGTSGNSITVAFTAGATAGAEVVTVSGNAISVQIETGVSTVTQVRTAMQAAAACTALVTTTGTSSGTVATASAVSLTGGIDGVASHTIKGVASVARTGVGEYTITMQDPYVELKSCNLTIEAASAVDLVPQIKSDDVVSAKTIVFHLLAGATPTEVAAALSVNVCILFNDSTVAN